MGCTARRNRSNTPLQSLTLLNDPMFLELARSLAEQAVATYDSPRARATHLFRAMLTRPPRESELARLIAFQQAQATRVAAGQLDPKVVLGKGSARGEVTSWFLVARALMNLDETITR